MAGRQTKTEKPKAQTFLVEHLSGAAGIRRIATAPIVWIVAVMLAVFILIAGVFSSTVTYSALAVFEGDAGLVLQGMKHDLHAVRHELEKLFVPPPEIESRLTTVRITTLDNTLFRMQQAIMHGEKSSHEEGGDRPYFKASIQMDDKLPQRASISLRGASKWHHEEKPSFRVKLKKPEVNGTDRYLELSRPEDTLALKNWLPAKLAGKLGLLGEKVEHVRLFVNNKYFGVYLLTMRQGEPLAIANNRMPGTFFKGDFNNDLWKSIKAWNIAGEQSPEDIEVFKRFLTLVTTPVTGDSLEELSKIFDFDTYAKWAALMAVTGSIHTDVMHNQNYYFCANQGKLEAVPWDCCSFGIHASPDMPVDLVRDMVSNVMLADPAWVHERDRIIYELMNGIASPDNLTRMIEERYALLKADLRADRNLGNQINTGLGWRMIASSPFELDSEKERLTAWIEERHKFLENYLSNAQVTVVTHPNQPDQPNQHLTIIASGNVACKLASGSRIFYPGLSRSNTLFDLPSADALPAKRKKNTPPVPPLFFNQEQALVLNPVPLAYDFYGDARTLKFVNAVTGKPVKAQYKQASPGYNSAESKDCRTILPPPASTKAPEAVVLGPGDVVVDKDLVVPRGAKLVLNPGTRLRLGKGAGVYCQGQVLAIGQADRRIAIEPDGKSLWSAFCIFGPKSGGSQLKYVDIKGGSTGKFQERRFKGMLSIYNCPKVVIEHCRIGHNFIGDDSINIAESNFAISDSSWTDANADALDLDMSEGTIKNCRFERSGNDGIDAMGTRLDVRDCTIIGSADKGISAGENSKINIERVSLERCAQGVQVKDSSFVHLKDCRLINNKVAASAYQKKAFYQNGGTAIFENCKFENNSLDLHPQERCSFKLVGTAVNRCRGKAKRFELEGGSKIQLLENQDTPILPNHL